MEALIGLAILFFVVLIPALAIMAFVRSGRGQMGVSEEQFRQVLARLWGVEQRLTELERRGSASQVAAPAPDAVETGDETPGGARFSPGPGAEDAQAPVRPPPPPISAPVPPPARRLDLETLIAGRGLNYVGIIALVFAVAFFLKYAFENNWIGPAGRVAIGLFSGAILLVFSQWLLHRGYQYFSEGIAGLGSAVLYLSLYAGRVYYDLFAREVAFAGMFGVVVLTAFLAVGRNSERIAWLSALGGFLTPVLLSTGTDQQVALFTYVLLLDGGLLILGEYRGWRGIQILAFGGTQFFFWMWYASYYEPPRLAATVAFASGFFSLFFAAVAAAGRRLPRLPDASAAMALMNAFWFTASLHAMLWPDRRWALTFAVLGLSALHLAAARFASPDRRPAEALPLARLLFAGLALTLATVAIPIRLEGKWITIAWAVEAGVLAWTGFRTRLPALRYMALALFAITIFRLYAFPIPAAAFFVNARFAAYAVTVASAAAAAYFAQQNRAALTSEEDNLFRLLGIAVHAVALTALSLEVWDAFARNPRAIPADTNLAQQLGLSLLWSAYAAALTVTGVRRASATLRWIGLALFGVVVAKVFFFDLSFLERGYRILSFMVLGLLLLVVSFLYQRRVPGGKEGRGARGGG